jgi:hypothetical protein
MAKSFGSSIKISFGKRREGKSFKRHNKHERKTKPYIGQGK